MHAVTHELYDRIDIKEFERYAQKRSKYLATVEDLIAARVPHPCSLLDIGCGTGARAKRLQDRLAIRYTKLVDSARKLVEYCRLTYPDLGVVHESIETELSIREVFDLVTCLWNVLGHVRNPEMAIYRMSRLLSKNGTLVIDVNNRYNVQQYGFWNVVKNIITKNMSTFPIKNRIFETNGFVHLFAPDELDPMITKAGLRITKKYYVDYDSGKIVTSRLRGQILYFCNKH